MTVPVRVLPRHERRLPKSCGALCQVRSARLPPVSRSFGTGKPVLKHVRAVLLHLVARAVPDFRMRHVTAERPRRVGYSDVAEGVAVLGLVSLGAVEVELLERPYVSVGRTGIRAVAPTPRDGLQSIERVHRTYRA